MSGPNTSPAPTGRIPAWPSLMLRELCVLLAASCLLAAAALVFDAPLGLPGHEGTVGEDAKAPWYLVGLQELAAHLDPWIAGAGIPMALVTGLILFPYVSRRERHEAELGLGPRFFVAGSALWLGLLLTGALFRGPGWSFCPPWRNCFGARALLTAERTIGGCSPWVKGAACLLALAVASVASPLAWKGKPRRTWWRVAATALGLGGLAVLLASLLVSAVLESS